jgi:CIC family chloride channel protein
LHTSEQPITQDKNETRATRSLMGWWHVRAQDDGAVENSTALLEASIIGAISAVAAFVFLRGTVLLSALRVSLCDHIPAWIVLPAIGMLGGAICGSFVTFIAPEITGSGIPQVKAFLKGFPIKLDIRVAFSKLLGGIIALGIGLPLGREGPTVQVGAATAAVLGRVGYQSPRHRRQLIAAGAGAGLAAAFNAPLAGVIFIVEELLKDVSSHTLGTALLSCFFAGIVAHFMGNHTLDVSAGREFPHSSFLPENVPFLLLLGLLAGIVGSGFNEAILRSAKWQTKIFGKRYILRIALAGLICGLVIALLPSSFRDFAGIRQLIFEDRSWRFATVALVSNFFLTALAYGAGSPGGLFAPSLTIGAALGYLLGLAEMVVFPAATHSPTALALAGMGAVFAAVARVPITATVIVFEMTTDFNLLLPLMVSSIMAFLIGEKLAPGSIYDRLLELQGIFLNEKDENDPLSNIIVKNVMSLSVESAAAAMPLSELVQKFQTSSHRAFPVIEEGKLVGMISQSDLTSKLTLLSHDAKVKEAMTPLVVYAHKDDSLRVVVNILDEKGLSGLPVLESDGTIAGIVSRKDIISALAQRQDA